MTLTLSGRDVAAFVALQEVLLSPLEHTKVDDWCRAVLRRTETLFDGDRSAMLVPLNGHIHYVSETIDPHSLAAFEQSIAELRPGALQFSDVAEDRAWNARRVEKREVWSISMAARLAGMVMEDIPVYHEAVKPAGIAYGPVASTALSEGEAFLGVACSQPRLDRFGEEASLELMAMVLPSFKAGVHALVSLADYRLALGGLLDALEDAVVLSDASGAELHRNSALHELLASDPERARLDNEMRAAADLLRRIKRYGADGSPASAGSVTVQTHAARYRIDATYLPRSVLQRDETVLVTLRRLTPKLPAAEELIARYGLTRREAEVALLLAAGLSNRDIGSRLAVSPLTVRRHAEWIFEKLGIHSRKALALQLLADNG